MANIRSFRELRVWQTAIDLAVTIHKLSGDFPAHERYSLTDQIRRSSRSVAANISEAWRKRRYPAAFVAKLSDAEGEAAETQTWIEFSRLFGYMSSDTAAQLDRDCEAILAQLVTMISNPESWSISPSKSTPQREDAATK